MAAIIVILRAIVAVHSGERPMVERRSDLHNRDSFQKMLQLSLLWPDRGHCEALDHDQPEIVLF
jgi:hypothetical protein